MRINYLTKSSNQSNAFNYYPFGLEIEALSYTSSVLDADEGFNGKKNKEELEMLDFGARMYDASIARWFSADPLSSLATNWSSFRFGYNSPLNWSDPSGMIEVNGHSKYSSGNEWGRSGFSDDWDRAYIDYTTGSSIPTSNGWGEWGLSSFASGAFNAPGRMGIDAVLQAEKNYVDWSNLFMQRQTAEQLDAYRANGLWHIQLGHENAAGEFVLHSEYYASMGELIDRYLAAQLYAEIDNPIYFGRMDEENSSKSLVFGKYTNNVGTHATLGAGISTMTRLAAKINGKSTIKAGTYLKSAKTLMQENALLMGQISGVAKKVGDRLGVVSMIDHTAELVDAYNRGDERNMAVNIAKIGLDVGLIIYKANPYVLAFSVGYSLLDGAGVLKF